MHRHAILNDTTPNAPSDFFPGIKFDYVVQAGSPFIWDQMHLSEKWKNFMTCRQAQPSAKFIMLGIGDCFLENDSHVVIDREVLDLFKDSLVIVRSHIAQRVLLDAGVGCSYLPCPAFLSVPSGIGRHTCDSATVVWYDPRFGCSAVGWQDPSKFAAYLDRFTDFIEKESVETIHYVADCEHPSLIPRLGGKKVVKLNNPKDVIDMVTGYRKILSGRVHCAVPAKVAGCEVELLAVDSRAEAFYDFNYINQEKILEKYEWVLSNA